MRNLKKPKPQDRKEDQPIYKKRRVPEIYKVCPKCNEELVYQNKGIGAYECKCGVWMQEWFTSNWNYIPKTV